MKYDHIRKLADRFNLVLGSRAPRRLALLREIGIEFRQVIPVIEEEQAAGEQPPAFARRLAEHKAMVAAGQVDSGHLVIGCDTIVVLDDTVLQKPTGEDNAFDILSALSGRSHVVCTAVALAGKEAVLASGYELTEVIFKVVSAAQIRDYIATGEPMDKAGAYGIQGMGAFLVDRINGKLNNIVGLPRTLLNRLAEEVLNRQDNRH